jgi:hypothetical protein
MYSVEQEVVERVGDSGDHRDRVVKIIRIERSGRITTDTGRTYDEYGMGDGDPLLPYRSIRSMQYKDLPKRKH